jgi:hypothetical protein
MAPFVLVAMMFSSQPARAAIGGIGQLHLTTKIVFNGLQLDGGVDGVMIDPQFLPRLV